MPVVTPANSQSFKISTAAGNNIFNISYGGGTNIDTGKFIEETMVIGGVKLDGLTMGLGSDATDHFGIIGLGYNNGEAAAERNGKGFVYNNLPAALVKSGAANSLAFSMYLNDKSKRVPSPRPFPTTTITEALNHIS
jgi:hypothetical protein